MRKDGLTSWDAMKAKIERKDELLKQAKEILSMVLDLANPTAMELFGTSEVRKMLSLEARIEKETENER